MNDQKVVISLNNTKCEFSRTKYKLFFVNELCKDLRHDFKLFNTGGCQFERLFDFVSELIDSNIFPAKFNTVLDGILNKQLERV